MKYVRVLVKQMQDFCVECFLKFGVPKEDAENVAEHLILANLRGVDSHGIMRVPYYREGIRKGLVKPVAEISIVNESTGISLLDGGNGLGIPVATKATGLAIDKAKSIGFGIVGVRNLGHVGMLAYYIKKVIEHGFVGFACVNAPATMAPWGGREKVFGTNPMCVGFPIDERKTIILDMATSVMAHFKIKVAALKGEKISEGVALDKQGRPTTDSKEAFEGVLLPFGGYKGYGLALAVEVLTSALLGAPQSKNIPLHPSTQGGFFILVIDVNRFRNYDEYKNDMMHLVSMVRSSQLAEGFKEILLPGEIEEREAEKRLRDGIPLAVTTWDELLKLAQELNIEPLSERGVP